jgi:hypothetical protein
MSGEMIPFVPQNQNADSVEQLAMANAIVRGELPIADCNCRAEVQ